MNEQHDWHCWVTWLGANWKIVRIEHGYLVHLARSWICPVHGWWEVERTVMDISKVDFAAYCEATLNWDLRRRKHVG